MMWYDQFIEDYGSELVMLIGFVLIVFARRYLKNKKVRDKYLERLKKGLDEYGEIERSDIMLQELGIYFPKGQDQFDQIAVFYIGGAYLVIVLGAHMIVFGLLMRFYF